MKYIWDYISGRARGLLTKQQMVKAITASLGFFHFFLLLFFASQHVTFMAFFNVFSVLYYITCFVMALKNVKPILVFDLCYFEVVLHVVLASLMVGTESGFSLYLVAMIPFAYYASYSFREEERYVNPMVYVVISVVSFCIVRLLCVIFKPFYSYNDSMVEYVIYMINFFVVVAAVVVFMSTFLIQFMTMEELRVRQNKRLELLSTVDVLTGLFNRRSIKDRYSKAQREHEQYSVILGDIDDFKKVNDNYGHDIGDVVLKQVADVFKGSVRLDDVVCRWGGEEILVFLPQCRKDAAVLIAERILDKIRGLAVSTDNGILRVTMTLGVAESNESENFKGVTKIADDRLYDGKHSGKNRVVSFMENKAS